MTVETVRPGDLTGNARYILVRNVSSRSRVYFAGVLGEDREETTQDVSRARIFTGRSLQEDPTWPAHWDAVRAADLLDLVEAEARAAKEAG